VEQQQTFLKKNNLRRLQPWRACAICLGPPAEKSELAATHPYRWRDSAQDYAIIDCRHGLDPSRFTDFLHQLF
jgi:hypothetical protein